MVDRLSLFLADAAGTPYRLGERDCGLWLADWYMAATGKPDPAPHLRGIEYGEHHAGPRAYVVRKIARAEGLKRTSDPKRGDVGLVSVEKGHLVGGIFTGTHWCVLIDTHGIGMLPPDRFRFIAAWSVV